MLKTKRLEILPLTPRLFRLWITDLAALESEISCHYMGETFDEEFHSILLSQLAIVEKDPESYLWSSFWLIIRRSDNAIIGSADFKAPPQDGEVEIGYGLSKNFEHCGFMTETVSAMCDWALSQSGVDAVIAETETGNLASQAVLQRCGFHRYKSGETFWFKKEKGTV